MSIITLQFAGLRNAFCKRAECEACLHVCGVSKKKIMENPNCSGDALWRRLCSSALLTWQHRHGQRRRGGGGVLHKQTGHCLNLTHFASSTKPVLSQELVSPFRQTKPVLS